MNLLPFIVSFIIAVGVTPLVIMVYRKKGWIDDPKKNNHPKVVHTKPTPRGGGIVIFIAVLLATILFIPFSKHISGILLGALMITCIGFLDDIHNLHPMVRLPLLFAVALCVVAFGIGIAYVSNPFGAGVIHLDQPQIPIHLFGETHTIWVLADIFAVLWIVWSMNVVNWSKGLDGQMPGFVGIAAFIISLLSLRFIDDPTQGSVTLLALIVSGAFFGFLVWNMYPQKIMAGYGAGTLAGFFLAVLSILSGAKVATALLVLAIPTIDAMFVISRRVVSGKSPIWGDRGHLHHRLMDRGWGKRRIAAFYWITTAILGILALQLNSRQKMYTIVAITVALGGFIAWLKLYTTFSKQHGQGNG